MDFLVRLQGMTAKNLMPCGVHHLWSALTMLMHEPTWLVHSIKEKGMKNILTTTLVVDIFTIVVVKEWYQEMNYEV